jgi:hypothetical protein
VHKASRVVVVCMKLHNFIINCIVVPDIFEEDNEQHLDAPDRQVHFQDDVDTDDIMHRRRRYLESSPLREIMTQELKDMGLRCPNWYYCAT